jgi:hypothetical protein
MNEVMQKAEERLLESLEIDKYNFFALAEFVKETLGSGNKSQIIII